MRTNHAKVIGIVGGMGPQAGISLFNAVLTYTPASSDQEHLSVILMSYPGCITDRTDFLEGKNCINPAYNIAGLIARMEEAGAGVIGIACNTAHSPRILDVVLNELEKSRSRVKLVHMPYETCRFISETYQGVCRVGLMVTNGTYKSGLYDNLLKSFGFEPVVPDAVFQNDVIHRMIYDPVFGLKADTQKVSGEVEILLDRALAYFKKMKTDAIILGCTEFSLLLKEKFFNGMHIIDATDVLALSMVQKATRPCTFGKAVQCSGKCKSCLLKQ